MNPLVNNARLFDAALHKHLNVVLGNNQVVYCHPLFIASLCANQTAIDPAAAAKTLVRSKIVSPITNTGNWESLPTDIFELFLNNPEAAIFQVRKPNLGTSQNSSNDRKIEIYRAKFFPELKLQDGLTNTLLPASTVFGDKEMDLNAAVGGQTGEQEIDTSEQELDPSDTTAPLGASNAWEPLKIDRQSSDAESAITATEKALQTISQDNGYAANDPDERNQIVETLRYGLDKLRNNSLLYRFQFEAFVWQPLNRIAKKFKDTAMGISASAAKEALKEWLKEAIKSVV